MSESLFVGIISGITSSIIVSLLLWMARHHRRPPVDLIHVAANRAMIRNNRCRPIIIGGAWELGNGNVLYRPDGFRGGAAGFYISGYSRFEVGTSRFNVGQTADICFKRVRVRDAFRRRSELEQDNIIDVSTFVVNPKAHPEWKTARVKLRANLQ